jgi:hypothetical protein
MLLMKFAAETIVMQAIYALQPVTIFYIRRMAAMRLIPVSW